MRWKFFSCEPHTPETWTCGRCCSCAPSSASAPGTKVRMTKTLIQPPLHAFSRSDQKEEIIDQIRFKTGGEKKSWMWLAGFGVSGLCVVVEDFCTTFLHAFEASSPPGWCVLIRGCVYVEGVDSGGSAVCIWGTLVRTELSLWKRLRLQDQISGSLNFTFFLNSSPCSSSCELNYCKQPPHPVSVGLSGSVYSTSLMSFSPGVE